MVTYTHHVGAVPCACPDVVRVLHQGDHKGTPLHKFVFVGAKYISPENQTIFNGGA